MAENQGLHHRPCPDGIRKTRVAIIGTGLAGLTSAYLLHRDKKSRYEVTLFEQGERLSLDAASVTVTNDRTGTAERIDIPPRSFTKGYYTNLCSLYDHLSIPLHPIKYIWVFVKALTAAHVEVPEAKDAESMPGSYFVFSNLRELVLSPCRYRSSLQQVLQALYLAICHIWFLVACFCFPPVNSLRISPVRNIREGKQELGSVELGEPLSQYLERIWLPQEYILWHLLPLLSTVCSCSHEEMLAFPASDVVGLVKGTFRQQTYVTCGGVHKVQSGLAHGIQDIRLGARVTKVHPVDGSLSIQWEQKTRDQNAQVFEENFDRVILAVPASVAASIFAPARSTLGEIPTAPIASSILSPASGEISMTKGSDSKALATKCLNHAGKPQVMTFRTVFTGKTAQTESLHYLRSGVVVTSTPVALVAESERALHTARFTRTLRTTWSRFVTQKIMGTKSDNEQEWVNGKSNVWVAGSWCWDGMVLLEGCIVSAMRVATDFGVDIPW